MSEKLKDSMKIGPVIEEEVSKEDTVDRVVPISIPEVISVKDNSEHILLEFGHIKNSNDGDAIIIDVRKLLTIEMAKKIYSDLKRILD